MGFNMKAYCNLLVTIL